MIYCHEKRQILFRVLLSSSGYLSCFLNDYIFYLMNLPKKKGNSIQHTTIFQSPLSVSITRWCEHAKPWRDTSGSTPAFIHAWSPNKIFLYATYNIFTYEKFSQFSCQCAGLSLRHQTVYLRDHMSRWQRREKNSKVIKDSPSHQSFNIYPWKD